MFSSSLCKISKHLNLYHPVPKSLQLLHHYGQYPSKNVPSFMNLISPSRNSSSLKISLIQKKYFSHSPITDKQKLEEALEEEETEFDEDQDETEPDFSNDFDIPSDKNHSHSHGSQLKNHTHESDYESHDSGIPSVGENFKHFFEGASERDAKLNSKKKGPTHPSDHTFVSSYYKIDDSIFAPYLDRKHIVYKMTDRGQIIIKDCPFCHDTKMQVSNLWKLYIYTENGRYFCFRCNSQGSWFDFQKRMGDSFGPTSLKLTSVSSNQGSNESTPVQPKFPDRAKLDKYISNLQKLPQALDYLLNTRGLSMEVIEKYKVGACVLRIFMPDTDEHGVVTGLPDKAEDHICITFPWMSIKNGKEIYTRSKSRSIKAKGTQRLEPTGGKWGLFGLHLVPQDATSIVITEGEFDAMAVCQATGIPAVSLPAGANCFPVEIVEMLERFDKIFLWMDDDVVGQQGAYKFATKLGRERVWIVQTRAGKKDGPKDANDALKANVDLKSLLEQAQRIPHKEVMQFTELRDAVYRELANPGQVAGVQCLSFPTLNKLIRGHRKGELTIFSGSTGIGKTTILSQLSLDYIVQGVSTLWGSFELNNTRLAKKLLTQYAQKDLEQHIAEFQVYADRFAALPLYFMRFHGSTELEQVIDAMEYSVYVHDVEHIVLDNLQFMTPNVLGKGNFEKFDQLDTAISKLRKFATTHNVHISLIIHPRKEDDGHALSTSSVFGSAKATQEADNVIIVQHGRHYRYLEVTKNRFTGDLGKIPYKYTRSTNRYVEMTLAEIQEAQKGAKPQIKS